MGAEYKVYNAAVPTTAAMTSVATGTAIKTLLQVTAPATRQLVITKWGISFTATPAAIACELINTTTVAGTGMTAVTPSTMTPGIPASLATAGYSPSAEGTVVATTRVFDHQIITANQYVWEWSLGRENVLDVSQVLRVRVTAAATVNAICFICWEE